MKPKRENDIWHCYGSECFCLPQIHMLESCWSPVLVLEACPTSGWISDCSLQICESKDVLLEATQCVVLC